MTLRADGTAVCDDCGGSAGNGGVTDALVVSDLDFGTGKIVNLHFCRIGVSGTSCAARRLSGVTAANYPHSQHDAASWAAAQNEAVKAAESIVEAAATSSSGSGMVADGVVLTPEQSREIEQQAAQDEPKPKRRRRTTK